MFTLMPKRRLLYANRRFIYCVQQAINSGKSGGYTLNCMVRGEVIKAYRSDGTAYQIAVYEGIFTIYVLAIRSIGDPSKYQYVDEYIDVDEVVEQFFV